MDRVVREADIAYEACDSTLRIAGHNFGFDFRNRSSWQENPFGEDEVVCKQENKTGNGCCNLCRIFRIHQSNHHYKGRKF